MSDEAVIEVGDLTSKAIQAAINALPPTGGIVRLGRGVFEVTRMLRLRDGTTLEGRGPTETVLALAPGTSSHLFTNAGGHAGGRDLELRHLGLLGRAGQQPTPEGHERFPFSCGSFLRGVEGVVVRDVIARDIRSTAFHFERCRHVRVLDVETHGVGWSGVSTAATDDIEVRGLLATDSGRDTKHSAVHLGGGVGARVEAVVEGATGTGIMLEAASASLEDVVVRATATGCAIGFSASAVEGRVLRHVLATGDYSGNRETGVRIANAERITVADAVIRDNGVQGVLLHGLRGARECVVAACTIEGNPTAVVERDGSGDNLVVGNSHQVAPPPGGSARAKARRAVDRARRAVAPHRDRSV